MARAQGSPVSRSLVQLWSWLLPFLFALGGILASSAALAGPTSITMTASPNPVAQGQPVTLTATVAGGSNLISTVRFYDDGVELARVNLVGNVATLSGVTLSVGTHPLWALYPGDANNDYSETAEYLYLTVTAGAQTSTATSLTSSVNPSTVGQNTTLTATVTPSAATGSVTFRDGATTIGTGTLSAGVATLSTSFSASGARSLTAVYAGNASYTTSTSSAVSQTVNTGALTSTTTALTSSVNPSGVGQNTTLTATVTPSSATGTVTFKDGATTLGTGTLSGGVATLATSFASAGTKSLTAVYGGNASNNTSTSAALSQSVSAAPPPPQGGTAVPDPYAQTRTVSFTYYGASDGSKNGLLKTETVEPNNTQLCVVTTHDYDSTGNKTSTSTANCAGASGRAIFSSRAASSTYSSQTVTVAGVTGVVIPAGAFPVTASNALNQSETRTYDPRFGAVTGLTGPNALSTTWQLDNFGRKTQETRADGTRTVSAYCYISGRINGADLSSNSSTTSGDPLSCPAPAAAEIPGDATLFVHSEPRSTANAKNGPFTRTYSDKAGRTIRSVTEAFDGASQPGGTGRLVVQDTDHNQYGAQIVATQPYFLDTCASTASAASSCPSGSYGMSRTDYDALGRPTTIYTTDPLGAGGSQSFGNSGSRGNRVTAKTTIAYAGLVTTTTNDKNQARVEQKNVDGKLVRITDALGAQLAHQHDAFGNLVATKDALQNTTTIAYDARGRKVSITDPDTGLWTYDYNALGELVWQQSPNQRAATLAAAQQTTMAYDVLGRMTSRVEPEYTSTWSYDTYIGGGACTKGIGKLCESNTTNGVNRKQVYDSLGRPLNSRTTITSGPSFASTVSYDATHGRLASMTYPTGVKVNYGYTAKGYLSQLTLAQAATITPLPATAGGTAGSAFSLAANSSLWSAQAYNAWGRAEQSTQGNGVVSRAVFDAATGRVSSSTAGKATATETVHLGYTWDSLNRLVQRNDNLGDGSTGAVTDNYAYDSIGRLQSYTVAAPAIAGSSRTVTLQYNALGMLLYKSDVGVYTYGAQATAGVKPHALQSVSGAVTVSNTFDANGNLATASSGKYRSVSYTSFNLPDSQTGLQGASGSPKYTWVYDERHARIKETRVVAGATRTTWNLHPDNQGGLGFECEGAGSDVSCSTASTQRRHYLSAGGTSLGVLVSTGALPTLAAADRAPPVVTGTLAVVKLEYWHKDHLGSLIATTDHTGAATARYAYDPFGKRRQANGNYDAFGSLVIDWTTNTNKGTDRGYTGHEQLDDVGLVHMNGRIFDPALGRFMQGDPLIQSPANLQNFDRYGYCYNNPLTCTDPSGMSSWTSFRDGAIRAVAAVADGWFCYGFCSAAVGAYQGRRTGGDRGAFVGAVVGYFGYQLNVGGYSEAAVVGFSAAAGCAGAWASGGKCGQGVVGGVVQYYGGQYGFEGQVAAGCVSGAVTGGSCREGARGAFASSLGSSVGTWVGQSAYEQMSRPRAVVVQTDSFGSAVNVASADNSVALEYLIGQVANAPALPVLVGGGFAEWVGGLGNRLLGIFSLPLGLSGDTTRDDSLERVNRYMSQAEAEATMRTGLARGGRDGVTFVTNDFYSTASAAQRALALPGMPEVMLVFSVTTGTFSPPTTVDPAFGQPGGGTERTGTGRIPVKVLDIVKLKPGG
ncbi:MAG: hypothetical protein AD742_11460 [Methylibium sp. NZG]|nr:MAG: hypothetical protein AD742_11460 [Methylibium sp. NZG]